MSGLAALVASCMIAAAQTHGLSPSTLFVILHIEGGRVGEYSKNTNGTRDLGPMQVNTIWLPEVARRFNTDRSRAERAMLDDPCVNIETGAWILRGRIDATGDVATGIAHYHSATPRFGQAYLRRFHEKALKIDAALTRSGQIESGRFYRAAFAPPVGFRQMPSAAPRMAGASNGSASVFGSGPMAMSAEAPIRVLPPVFEGGLAQAMGVDPATRNAGGNRNGR
ncbi:MAG: lytic transglycosylase domain-containing protein [Azospirillum sp.]|nr:lytic transglycosylase domain-containing protein [Azospirillum sp.]